MFACWLFTRAASSSVLLASDVHVQRTPDINVLHGNVQWPSVRGRERCGTAPVVPRPGLALRAQYINAQQCNKMKDHVLGYGYG